MEVKDRVESKTTTERTGSWPVRALLLASLFAALTALGAFLRIPIPYVPITLQTLFVILSGMILGPRFAALSQILYLAVGLAGVPVFANGGGPGYVLQPTFGYLLAFPFAAYTVGKLSHHPDRPSSFRCDCLAGAAGVLIILVVGALVLYLNFKYAINRPMALKDLAVGYFLLFIPGGIIKIATSAFIAQTLRNTVPAGLLRL